MAQPDHAAVLHLNHRVDQVKVPGHRVGGDEDRPVPLDGPGVIGVAVGVQGAVGGKGIGQGPPAAVEHQAALVAAEHLGDAQGLPGRAGEDGAGDVDITAAPEGHGIVREGQDIAADGGEVDPARRPGGGEGKLERQQET